MRVERKPGGGIWPVLKGLFVFNMAIFPPAEGEG